MIHPETGLIVPGHVPLQPPLELNFFPGLALADGRYKLEERLRPSNPNVEVYRAEDHLAGGRVALKILHEPDYATQQLVDAELEANALLSHHGDVTPTRDMGKLEAYGRAYRYIATDFASGATLIEKLTSEPDEHDIRIVAEAVAQTARVLDRLHEEGIIHHDIKPGNIFNYGGDGENDWKLGDFGLVEINPTKPWAVEKGIGGLAVRSEAATGTQLGTLGFIAPEVYNEEAPIISGPKIDVFALGVTLFRGITGKFPYKGTGGSSEVTYMRSVLNESPVAPEALSRSVSAELSQLTLECIDKDPDKRPDALAIAQRLETV